MCCPLPQPRSTSGQYGFADTHATERPPDPQWGIEGVTPILNDDSGDSFADIEFNTVLFTEANFRQYDPPSEPDRGALPHTIRRSHRRERQRRRWEHLHASSGDR